LIIIQKRKISPSRLEEILFLFLRRLSKSDNPDELKFGLLKLRFLPVTPGSFYIEGFPISTFLGSTLQNTLRSMFLGLLQGLMPSAVKFWLTSKVLTPLSG
jgi:hypothetical protein